MPNDQIRHGITYGEMRILAGQTHTNVSRRLLAIAELLVFLHITVYLFRYTVFRP